MHKGRDTPTLEKRCGIDAIRVSDCSVCEQGRAQSTALRRTSPHRQPPVKWFMTGLLSIRLQCQKIIVLHRCVVLAETPRCCHFPCAFFSLTLACAPNYTAAVFIFWVRQWALVRAIVVASPTLAHSRQDNAGFPSPAVILPGMMVIFMPRPRLRRGMQLQQQQHPPSTFAADAVSRRCCQPASPSSMRCPAR